MALADLLNNENFQIGMEMLGGHRSYGDALNLLTTADYNTQKTQQQKAQFEQQQYMRENIGQLMGQLDPNDLAGSFATLVKAGVPIPNASALVDSIRKQQAQNQTQKLMAWAMGGGEMGVPTVPGVPGQPDQGSIDATVGVGGGGSILPQAQPGQSISEAAAAGAPSQGGSGLDPNRLRMVGLLTGSPEFVSAGNFLQGQGNKDRDYRSGRGDEKFDRTRTLSKDFVTESKTYNDTVQSFQNVLDGASQTNGVGDMTLLYGYMKMIDPGAAIQEGDRANAQNAGGVSSSVRNAYNKLLDGDSFSPETRQKYIVQASKIYNSRANEQKKRVDKYRKFASDFNVNPENVITEPVAINNPFDQETIPNGGNVSPGNGKELSYDPKTGGFY